MALKRISRKKMVDAINEVFDAFCVKNFSRISETFVKYKIDIKTVDPNGCTLLWDVGTFIIVHNSSRRNRNIINCMQFLIDHGADVNHLNNFGETVLHLVVGVDRHNPEAVEMLIRNGADVNCVNNDGDSPLTIAIGSFRDNYPEVITPLLKAGADPYLQLNKKKRGCDTLEEFIEMWTGKRENTQLKATYLKAMKECGKLEE